METTRKKSSYQSMKEKYEKTIQELKADINVLLDESDSGVINREQVKLRYHLRNGIEDIIWAGNRKIETH